MIIALIAIGEKYREMLDSQVERLKASSHRVALLTDKPDYDFEWVEEYTEPKFSYFEKMYFSLRMIDKFEDDVYYIDVRYLEDIDLSNLEADMSKQFWFKGYWPYGDYLQDYEHLDYFEPFIYYCKANGIDYKRLEAIGETEFCFRKDVPTEELSRALENIQPIFRAMWHRQTNYECYDNAEGIALAFALKKLNIAI
jgi:hypothetical protein